MAISYKQEEEYMYTNIFSFGERLLPEYRTGDVVLSNSMLRPRKLICCVFNKYLLLIHWRDILNFSYKWLCFSNSYMCIGRKP